MIQTTMLIDLKDLLENKKCFILDFDGTIADTENLQWEAYNNCLTEYGVVLKLENIQKYIGHTEFEIYEMIKQDFAIDFVNEEFFKYRLNEYFSLTEKYKLIPFLYFEELIKNYGEHTFFVLSSQKKSVIEHFLSKWGVLSNFKGITSVFDDGISKERFLSDLYSFTGFTAEDAVLFEDTDRNLELGQKYGVMSIGIEHKYNQKLLKHCSAIIEGELIR